MEAGLDDHIWSVTGGGQACARLAAPAGIVRFDRNRLSRDSTPHNRVISPWQVIGKPDSAVSRTRRRLWKSAWVATRDSRSWTSEMALTMNEP